MTDYEYRSVRFDKETESVTVPDEAIGVTTDYFGDLAVVEYLYPIGESDTEDSTDFDTTATVNIEIESMEVDDEYLQRVIDRRLREMEQEATSEGGA